jgi:hypothetical protein
MAFLRTLLEEVVGAIAVSHVVELPRLTFGCEPSSRGILVDQDFNPPDVSFAVPSIGV